VLTILQVQQLVADGTAESHAALSRHFMALADTYAEDAARFSSLATTPGGDPNYPALYRGSRRVRQAEASARLAESARAMANYHELLSIGSTPSVPPDRTRFDGGFGATIPTVAEVRRCVASARTAIDHRVLSEYFLTIEVRETALARGYHAQAESIRVSGQRRSSEFAAMNWDRLATLAREEAKDASAAALLHRQLATIG
jgi:hypothetical protein